ncbi:MAG: hypothetical protein ACRD1K_10900 [Acidimicrobiales bacterium]
MPSGSGHKRFASSIAVGSTSSKAFTSSVTTFARHTVKYSPIVSVPLVIRRRISPPQT